ncbi:MAG: hypothetical protein ArsCj_4140 [Arsenophonus endosymbiont of Ceratovacuna japonica]
MFLKTPILNYQQQKEAVNRIHKLIANGMSSKEAITLVAKEIRIKYTTKK